MNALARLRVGLKCRDSTSKKTALGGVGRHRKIVCDTILINQCSKLPFARRRIVFVEGNSSWRDLDGVKRAGLRTRKHMRFSRIRAVKLAAKGFAQAWGDTWLDSLGDLGMCHLSNNGSIVSTSVKAIFRCVRIREICRSSDRVESYDIADCKELSRTGVLFAPETRRFRKRISCLGFRADHSAVVEIPSGHAKQSTVTCHVGDNQIICWHSPRPPPNPSRNLRLKREIYK